MTQMPTRRMVQAWASWQQRIKNGNAIRDNKGRFMKVKK